MILYEKYFNELNEKGATEEEKKLCSDFDKFKNELDRVSMLYYGQYCNEQLNFGIDAVQLLQEQIDHDKDYLEHLDEKRFRSERQRDLTRLKFAQQIARAEGIIKNKDRIERADDYPIEWYQLKIEDLKNYLRVFDVEMKKQTKIDMQKDIKKFEKIVELKQAMKEATEINFEELEKQEPFICKCASRINNNHRQKVATAKANISEMWQHCTKNNNELYFITMTFSDEVFGRLKENIRRKYIQQLLNMTCVDYIANIDFGDLNEREHYHAVVEIEKDKIETLSSCYAQKFESLFNYEKIETNSDTTEQITRLCHYIQKFASHSTKATTTGNRFLTKRHIQK